MFKRVAELRSSREFSTVTSTSLLSLKHHTEEKIDSDGPTYSKSGLRRLARSIYLWNSYPYDEKDVHSMANDTDRDRTLKLSSEEVNSREPYKNLKSRESLVSWKSDRPKDAAKRVVVVLGIPRSTSVSGLVAQVCGGPLERVNFFKSRGAAELYFMFPEHARTFLGYATRTNFFCVNGHTLTVEWANRHNTDDLDTFHPPLSTSLKREVVDWGARRCLVFSKTVPSKPSKGVLSLHYPLPKSHYSKDLDIEKVRKHMLVFGEIVEIGPVISRKLCFSVHFADVRSAIVAKKLCEAAGTMLHDAYYGWTLWYGKDPTDLPCKVL